MKEDAAKTSELLRPKNLAILLLASGDMSPRQRARDQKADLTGMGLKRRVLQAVCELDPDPADLELTLMQIVDDLGPPTGPTRSIAAAFLEEWRTACASPEWVAQLLGEAALRSAEGERRGRRLSS
ncbi:MAG: hypothetical protein ACJ8FY_07430 [Gemmataceae bacterium]